MRQLKFRVWDGKCFRGNLKKYFLNLHDGEISEVAYSDLYDEYYDASERGSKLTIQQFTGLKDKNGTEIYEGDIVNIFNHNQAEEVMYEPCGTAFGFFKHDSASREDGTFEVLSDYTGCDGYEIIGNIFENSELLEA